MREFKVGYNVKTVYGSGTIVFIDTDGVLLVDLGDNYDGHDGDGKGYRKTCKWFTELELKHLEDTHLKGGEAMMHTANKTITVNKPETPEPLENWKHPYYGKPILVKDDELETWSKRTFTAYVHGWEEPVVDSEGFGWEHYKFPDPIELTQEELLQIAAEAKGVDVEQIKIKE